ncbi:MAG: DUF2279 domain-containing protein [Bacteroidota bacterium]
MRCHSLIFNIVVIFLFLFFTVQLQAGEYKHFHSDLSLSDNYSGKISFTNLSTFDSTSSPVIENAPKVNYGRLVVLGGLMGGAIATIHIYQQNGWWQNNRAPFHFQEDLVYGLHVDKIGHFYGAMILTYFIRHTVETADVSESKSLLIGSAGALLFQTYVEVEDGFSTWGFDRVDFASDVGGALWPILQHSYPSLTNYELKFSYIPSDLLNRPGGSGFKGQKHLIIDDYEGQTFWLSMKVKNILPESAVYYWPSFLCLSVGYGARDIAGINASPYRVYYLSLDYDFTKIIPDSTPLLKHLGEVLNFIHFPAPAVRISPSTIWYGLYF